MTIERRTSKIQSWIPAEFVLAALPEVFPIFVSSQDSNIVEFISLGELEIQVNASKKLMLLFKEHDSLHGQLIEAIWDPQKLKPEGKRLAINSSVTAFCRGVYLMPDKKEICVLVSRIKNTSSPWYTLRLKFEADALFREHQARIIAFSDSIQQERASHKQFSQKLQERSATKDNFDSILDASIGIKEIYQKPVVTVDHLFEWLPLASKFLIPASGNAQKIQNSCLAAIASSGLRAPRDGSYTILLPAVKSQNANGLVTWLPSNGLPSYPEVRWAVQKRLPSALNKPRINQFNKPKFDTVMQTAQDSVQVQGIDPESTALKDVMDEIQLDQSDIRNRVDDIRSDVKNQGFEAIAWFQPYHVWTEETWGIYFDARKLDDLALSFLEDFKSHCIHGSHSLAAYLAFGLTYTHELFHARVEAALSWMEINVHQPRHLRYKKNVYQALRETPEWLEEALANWSAHEWFKSQNVQSMVIRMASKAEGLDRVVEASLDLAPPGYKDWRLGHDFRTWRTFANQLGTGKPKIAANAMGLPLESVLTSFLPYDFQFVDIPLHLVGPGVIADRLQSHPATFNVPPRRELERALKHFSHSLDVSGGKGGHQKWTGPDQRAFTLPTRDPVSKVVFKTFLHHVGIDKATYVRQVRPNL
jgi:hypothetical protein